MAEWMELYSDLDSNLGTSGSQRPLYLIKDKRRQMENHSLQGNPPHTFRTFRWTLPR